MHWFNSLISQLSLTAPLATNAICFLFLALICKICVNWLLICHRILWKTKCLWTALHSQEGQKKIIPKCKIDRRSSPNLKVTTEKHHPHIRTGGFSLSHNIHINFYGMLPLLYYILICPYGSQPGIFQNLQTYPWFENL